MPFNSVTGQYDPDLPVSPTQPVEPQPDVQGFLNTIEQIESNGGKNMNHPTMENGIHAGQAAMGRFGLMPNTLQEIAVRAQRDGSLNDQMKNAAAITDPAALKQQIEGNPEVERMFAEQLAKRLLKKFPNEQEAAFSWNQGHNLTPQAVEQRHYQDSDYVKKFNKLRMLLANK